MACETGAQQRAAVAMTIANRRVMLCLLLLNVWIRSSLGRGNISPAARGARPTGPNRAERRGPATSASAWRAFSAVQAHRLESLGHEKLRRSRRLRSSEQTEPPKSHKRCGFTGRPYGTDTLSRALWRAPLRDRIFNHEGHKGHKDFEQEGTEATEELPASSVASGTSCSKLSWPLLCALCELCGSLNS
jgi:hypothetical protein